LRCRCREPCMYICQLESPLEYWGSGH
jgi:hypothetical protein